MPQGYVTQDLIDLNDIWYGSGGVANAYDTYQKVELSIITGLASPRDLTLMKYGISAKNGFQALGPGERPNRKFVETAVLYPVYSKKGYGVGTDLDTLQLSTGRDVLLALNRPMLEDPEAVLTEFLRVMMVDPGTNNVRYGFWNGEFSAEEKITAPPQYQQRTFLAGHTHYLTSATANTITLEDFTAIKATVRHHGNKGQLAAFINTSTVQILEDLALFTQSSIIRSPITDQVSINGFSDRFQLVGLNFHVSEMIPDGYVLVVEMNAPDGERPLVMFEPPNMRGLRLHPGPDRDYPLVESFWDRWYGLKVWKRGAGAVLFFGAHSNVYIDPTFV